MINNYVDLDSVASQLLDYLGFTGSLARTYDGLNRNTGYQNEWSSWTGAGLCHPPRHRPLQWLSSLRWPVDPLSSGKPPWRAQQQILGEPSSKSWARSLGPSAC